MRKRPSVDIRFTAKAVWRIRWWGAISFRGTRSPRGEPLSIDVAYDRTRLAQDDIATATATVRNNLNKTANMVMVDLGIPPGFDLLSEDLQALPGEDARPEERAAGEVQPDGDAGDSVFRFDRRGGHGDVEVPAAGEVSDPRADVRVAGV